jgi:peptidylprolyl isomerase
MSSRTFRSRFVAASLAFLFVGGVVTGCSSDSDESSTGSVDTVAPSDTAATDDSVASTDGESTSTEEPTVEIPEEIPTELVITDLVEGTGDPAAEGDTVFVFYVGVRSEDGTKFDCNFGGEPFNVTLGQGGVIKGWDEGLVGIKAGGRRQLDIPADMAYGDQGAGEVIKPGDALSFIVDAVAIVPKTDPANEPEITVEGGEPIEEMKIEDLVVGEGAEAAAGKRVVAHLIAYRGDTGEELQNSWEVGPVTLKMDDAEVLPGLVKGFDGMKVGGRRLVTIPYADAFGEGGQEDLGLPAKTDLVMVLDLIAVI